MLLVEPQATLLRGLELLLTAHGFRVVGATRDAIETLELVDGHVAFDVAVVDAMPCGDGLRVLKLLRKQAPGLPVLAFGGRGAWPLQEILDTGVRGLVTTTGEADEFLEAIRAVAGGASYVDAALDMTEDADPSSRPGIALSDRERQILGLLAHGLTGSEVASRLFLSPATVRTHVQNAMRKLGARTRAHAVAMTAGGERAADPEAVHARM